MLVLAGTLWYTRSWERGFILHPLYELSSESKIIALTFDDGPSVSRTPPLLDLLDKHQVKATFFMLGENIARHPQLAKDVFARGHLIGNHSYDHPRLVFRSPTFVRDQIERTDTLILGLGQKEVCYFRPPGCSKYLVLPWLLSGMNKTLVTGTYDPPAEYRSPFPADDVARQVLANARPGAIIFLHDGKNADPEAFIRGVEQIILGLKADGYRFVMVDGKG